MTCSPLLELILISPKVWSEPARSLEVEPKQARFMERIVVPQIAGRVVLIDPSFLEWVTILVLFAFYTKC